MGLQSLTFGFKFNQSIQGVLVSSGLQSLIFGDYFDRTLEGVSVPSCLRSLKFGNDFDNTQDITFRYDFKRKTLEGPRLPSGPALSLTRRSVPVATLVSTL